MQKNRRIKEKELNQKRRAAIGRDTAIDRPAKLRKTRSEEVTEDSNKENRQPDLLTQEVTEGTRICTGYTMVKTNEEGAPLLDDGRLWFTMTLRGRALPHPMQGVFSLNPSVFDLRFEGVRLVVFGHLGDGNLHFNLSPAADRLGAEHSTAFVALEGPLNRLVHDAVSACGGSISAEHGLGVLRRDESARYKSPVALALMRTIKQALDPLNLMNPGKTLT